MANGPARRLYDELRTLKSRADQAALGAGTRPSSQSDMEKALRKPPYGIVNFRGQRLSEWLHDDFAQAKVPAPANSDAVWALAHYWSRQAGCETPARRHWADLVEAAQPNRSRVGAPDLRSRQLRGYLTAAARAAYEHPYPGILPGVGLPPLSSVYLRQRLQHDPHLRPAAGDPADEQRAPGRLVSTHEVLALPDSSIVVAGPGGGKSSLLRAWTTELAHPDADSPHPRLAPVLVQAATLTTRSTATSPMADPLPDALARAVTTELSQFGLTERLTGDFFRNPPMPQARWLVLIDGLDELASAADRQALLRSLAAHTADFPHLYRFIVATRPAPPNTLAHLGADARQYELLQFTPQDLPAVARNWFTALALPEPDRAVDSFLQALTRSGLKDPAGMPLMAAMLCQLFARNPDQPLPQGRGAVYTTFLDAMHRHHSLDGPGGLRTQMTLEMTRFGPSALTAAHHVLDQLPTLLDHLAWSRFFGDTAPTLHIIKSHRDAQGAPAIPQDVWDDFLTASLRRSGLLTRHGDDLDFLHQTFVEYCAARHTLGTHGATETSHHTQTRAPDTAQPHDTLSYTGFLVDLTPDWKSLPPEHSRPFTALLRTGSPTDAQYVAVLARLGTRLPEQLVHAALHALESSLGDPASSSLDEIETAEALERLGSPRGVEVLHNLAQAGDSSTTRRWAAEALAGIGDPRGLHLLNELAQEPEQRLHAAEALARLSDPRGFHHLDQLAGNSLAQLSSRVAAAEALARVGDARGIDYLNELACRTIADRLLPAEALARLGDVRGNTYLQELACGTTNSAQCRMDAVQALERTNRSLAMQALYAMACDTELRDSYRLWAIQELGLGVPEGTAHLGALAHNLQLAPKVQRWAAHALAGMGDSEGAEVLHDLACRTSHTARERWQAAQALIHIGDLRGHHLSQLLRRMALREVANQWSDAQIAQARDHPQPADRLAELALDTRVRPMVRIEAAQVMADLGDPRAADLLAHAAQDPTVSMANKVEAAQAMVELRDARAPQVLATLARDTTAGAVHRVRAARTLGEIDQPSAIECLDLLARDSTLGDAVREWAALALHRLDSLLAAHTLEILIRDTGMGLGRHLWTPGRHHTH